MMQMKFNFSNFIFHGVSATAWQRASGIRRRSWRLWLAYPIMTSFRYVSYVACVGWKHPLATDATSIRAANVRRLLFYNTK